MTQLAHPNLSVRQPPYAATELISDADPLQTGIFEHGDGSMVNYSPPGSVRSHTQVLRAPLPTGKSEGTEATSNQRNWGSFGAANEPSLTNKAGV